MKSPVSLFIFIITIIIFTSCQRELYYGVSIGVLKSNNSGKCFPLTIVGKFQADSVITDTNYISVQTDVSFPLTYHIYTDTLNGYYFSQSGNVNRGTNSIILHGFGKPKNPETDTFTLHYGNSKCNFSINIPPAPPAQFTLSGAPNTCNGIYISGSYIVDTPLNLSNTITVQALVTVPGSYIVNATTNNNISFSGSGVFTSTGVQMVTLTGTGVPAHSGTTIVNIKNLVSHCNVSLSVLDSLTDNKAMYTLDCSNLIVNGGYYAGLNLDAGNTITINVNVTKVGIYDIYTNPANGVTFGSSGSFLSLGVQPVTLTSTGVPTNAGLIDFIANTGGASHCNFQLNMLPLPPPATFTLSGTPNSCLPINVNGFYIHQKPLNAANSVSLQANVSNIGSYSISTNSNNGYSFSGKGVFTTTGLQTVILYSSGTPANVGNDLFIASIPGSSCGFTVAVK